MTDEQWRAPWSVRPTTLDLFEASEGAAVPVPAPSFEAKAAIWRDQRAGLISFAEAQRRSAAVGAEPAKSADGQQGRRGVARPPAARPRHERPSPNQSRQYAQPMATTAARDDRLTPNAKAFLQVLKARCGKGRETNITKGTAGNIMSRSVRTIRRYLVDLVRFGYVELEILRNNQGMHLGLTVKLTELVTPFFEEARGLARWLAETPSAEFMPFKGVVCPVKKGVTLLSSRNQTQIISPFAALKSNGTDRYAVREELMRMRKANMVPRS
ncbi:helix-turn-helix domain-containing protein [Fulvimarina sp. 2208YS6-2-32]|uniref:Helix-turn-helix domain-containing protein n=1 Tax=Fulvimarina uroteuthidis TaxID=3098149 RepID=A0ABU5I6S4_9HYPH|nr:helix-turn-helix domain-containing protein [Fulvimarina sp. 2208YS6-2-32]MDY8111088.1 helix-turn-helix domain-containing protein [Fulvimarina sp. 2208YS6-2-32]